MNVTNRRGRLDSRCRGLGPPPPLLLYHQEREVREVEQPIAAIVHTLEGSGKGATSAKNNDRFRGFLNSINVLENRAKARRRALLMVSCGVGAASYPDLSAAAE